MKVALEISRILEMAIHSSDSAAAVQPLAASAVLPVTVIVHLQHVKGLPTQEKLDLIS